MDGEGLPPGEEVETGDLVCPREEDKKARKKAADPPPGKARVPPPALQLHQRDGPIGVPDCQR